MKKISGLLSIVLLFALASCNSGPKGKKAETGEAHSAKSSKIETITYELNPDVSIMEWYGSKPTGDHYGTVNFARGFLEVADGQLVGGTIMIDMKSIKNEDLKDSPEYQKKLVDHLKSTDFFNVNSYPEALFEIVEVERLENPESQEGVTPTHKIKGNLTIKGITKGITFDAMVNTESGEITAITPQFIIDRTEWDVKYKSKKFFDDLKDQFIHDDIGLTIELKANKRS
ncbi:MAG: YceI family protein [Bacteroidales bacterium]|nr:YceI family protein [Bacteroidales bacterium]MCF8388924.1 YceI family protein [Bacteroidales bacterium]MCF8398081.1 YceI family protein [Bacteroidales bacterium]